MDQSTTTQIDKMSPEEAKAFGLIDEIATTRPAPKDGDDSKGRTTS